MDLALQPTSQSMQLHEDPLQPLRAMADRVGKEVEEFAERLDHWYTQSSDNEKAKHKATLKAVGKFRDIAESNVRELKKQRSAVGDGELDQSTKNRIASLMDDENTGSRSVYSSSESRSSSFTHPTSSAQTELRDWQAELATWELVRVVFDHYYPEPGTDREAAKKAHLNTIGGTDRRSSKNEVWERFIITDDLAREKKIVLKWLQQTAKRSERNVDSIMKQLAKNAGKDVDTWTSGWLETKATIKQTKLRYGVEGPLDPTLPVSSRSEPKKLVNRLDPDAQTREQLALEKPDVYYEHALWMACYEMLRRGDPLSEINDWFKARNQGYRAICIGASGEPRPEGAPNMGPPDLGYLFRRTTYLAAQSTSYPYEAAAYGMVSENYQKIQAISNSWDDHLYAYYNALLLSRFDNFLLMEPKGQPRAQKHPQLNFPGVMEHINNDWDKATQKVVELLKQDRRTSQEAKTPIKLIQSALLTGTLDELVTNVGIAIADAVQAKSSLSTFIVDPDYSDDAVREAGPDGIFSCRGKRSVVVPEYYQRFLDEPHALRILVHIFIILGNPRDPLSKQQQSTLFARGNVIAAYVEFLRLAQRLSPIPLYAAHIERWRASMTLARILPEIVDPDDQRRYVGLMEGYGVDVETTISRNFHHVLNQTGLVVGLNHEVAKPISKYELLDKPRKGLAVSTWPNGQHLKDQIVGTGIQREDDAVIDCLLWYAHLADKDEGQISLQVGQALAVFLRAGHVAAADKLVAQISDGNINVELDNHLPHFVRLITLFDQWRTEEKKFIQFRNRGEDLRINAKAGGPILRDILESITSTISVILEPMDDPSHTDVWDIYKIYIPEIILAYLAVLQVAFLFSKREHAIEAMDLIVAVARKEWLSKTFQESKRMRELVNRLADVSRSMVEVGEKSKVKVTKEGKTAHLWNLNRQS
ncbi:Nucleoporin nup84 [Paraconiothyrium brasiliense]|uniref:Nuclear pore complex protein n=1 Tax=Paraconiothyrium brasiliense TaxID=300254 RepID=A0ABR3R040_9PLEO